MNKITDIEIIEEINMALNEKRVPKIIHRLLLYDTEIPSAVIDTVERFEKINADFFHVLWKEEDVRRILTPDELEMYSSYTKNIQRADFARYIVIKHVGGIYVDLDVESNLPFMSFYNIYKSDDLFFIENERTLEQIESSKKYRIRNNIGESKTRIANCVLMGLKNSKNYKDILDLCSARHTLDILEPYDIIYTTGPDVVTTVINKKPLVKKISRFDSDRHFFHRCVGHWRENNTII